MRNLKILIVSLLASLSLTASAQFATPNPVTVTLDIHECYVGESLATTDKTMYYYVSYLEKELFDEYGYDDDATLADADKTWLEETSAGYGVSLEEGIEGLCYQGDFEEFQDGLLPDHDYVIWCHGVAQDGSCNTAITRIPFRTKPAQTTTARLHLDAQSTAEGVKVTCTPDDNDRFYTLGSIVKANMVDELTGNELSLRDYMQKGISQSLYDYLVGEGMDYWFEQSASKGPLSITFSGLQSGEEYYIVAAYLDDEAAICSEIATVEIDANGNLTSVKGIHNNADTEKSLYNINGTRVSGSLDDAPSGVYVVRNGAHTRKVLK